MATTKKSTAPVKTAPAPIKQQLREFEMHPTDVKLFWGILFGAGVLLTILCIVLIAMGRITNINTVLVWIILALGIPTLGYIYNSEYYFKVKNKKISRCCFMMKERAIDLSAIEYFMVKEGRNNTKTMCLYYPYRGHQSNFKIPSTYTNYDLLVQLAQANRWKERKTLR